MLLEEIYESCLSVEDVDRLFGRGVLGRFLEENEGFVVVDGCLFRSDNRRFLKNKKRREKISRRKMEIARKFLKYLERVPWVSFVAVSGSVSHGGAEEDDDIDVFIVVQRDRLWLVRGFELLLYRILGVRRKFEDKDVKDRICVNYYLSDDCLGLRPDGGMEREFLTALELAVLKPVLHEDFLGYLLGENAWVEDFFPAVGVSGSAGVRTNRRIPLLSALVDMLDWLAMKLEIGYMKFLKHPVEDSVVKRGVIKFYDRDGWKDVMGRKEEWFGGGDD